jgi:two-component system chemotaxis response regulator CheB
MSLVRVLIIEDSLVERTLMASLLSADPEIEVLGAVSSSVEALSFLAQQRPDVITLDMTMPDLNGYETTRRIMETTPVPIITVGEEWSAEEGGNAHRVLEVGAVAKMRKPPGVGSPEYAEAAQELIQAVKAMAEVKVVRRWARHRFSRSERGRGAVAAPETHLPQGPSDVMSLRGLLNWWTRRITNCLGALAQDFTLPVVIAQHIAPGFLDRLTKWLGQTTGHSVQIAAQRELLAPGHVSCARRISHGGRAAGVIVLRKDALEHGMRPAVSYLFRSVISTFGRKAVGVLLTGMGRDGAEELKHMRDSGSLTIAQDQETSVVFGMPGEAIRLGGATYVLPPEKIAALLNTLVDYSAGVLGSATSVGRAIESV